ncbi:BTB/POZ domain protein, partial [Teladorsagia circumcincta]
RPGRLAIFFLRAGVQLTVQSPTYNRHMPTGLEKLRDDSLLCDVALIVEGTRINAHRVILAACSNYFRDMFNNEVAEDGLQEIEIADMDALTLDSLVSFCYTGKIKITDSNVRSLLPAACLLQLDEVKIEFSELRACPLDTGREELDRGCLHYRPDVLVPDPLEPRPGAGPSQHPHLSGMELYLVVLRQGPAFATV